MAKVLIIDDSHTQAALIAQIVVSHNHIVEIEATGKKGLAHALQQDYDLVICDLNLPDLNGLDICRQYKNKGKTGRTLLVSSEDQLCHLNPANTTGVDYFCTKDIEPLSRRIELIFLQLRHKQLSRAR